MPAAPVGRIQAAGARAAAAEHLAASRVQRRSVLRNRQRRKAWQLNPEPGLRGIGDRELTFELTNATGPQTEFAATGGLEVLLRGDHNVTHRMLAAADTDRGFIAFVDDLGVVVAIAEAGLGPPQKGREIDRASHPGVGSDRQSRSLSTTGAPAAAAAAFLHRRRRINAEANAGADPPILSVGGRPARVECAGRPDEADNLVARGTDAERRG